jgi:hypothetical protein
MFRSSFPLPQRVGSVWPASRTGRLTHGTLCIGSLAQNTVGNYTGTEQVFRLRAETGSISETPFLNQKQDYE